MEILTLIEDFTEYPVFQYIEFWKESFSMKLVSSAHDFV